MSKTTKHLHHKYDILWTEVLNNLQIILKADSNFKLLGWAKLPATFSKSLSESSDKSFFMLAVKSVVTLIDHFSLYLWAIAYLLLQ